MDTPRLTASSFVTLIIMFSAPDTTVSQPRCPTFWTYNKPAGTCIMIFNYLPASKLRDWEGARSECQQKGGDLLTIRNAESNLAVQEIMKTQPREGHWIGLQKRGHLYYWLDDTEPITYTNWDSDSPSKVDPYAVCVAVGLQGNEKWTDIYRNYRGGYICEKSPDCGGKMYGFNCSKPCSSHCGGNFKTCFKDDGSCNEGCERGFQPPRCDTACAKGTYGQDCKDNCSEGCSGTDIDCDPADGTCIYGCVAGYWGSKCDNNNCPNQICPMSKPCSHCAGPDNRCYDNRTCMDGCSKGYFGETCDARCPNQTYGLNCAQRCSQNCGGQYKNCDHDGTCVDGCVENYYGDKCDESVDPKDVAAQKPSIMSTLGLSVLLILFLIVVVVTSIIMFYVNRDSKEKRLQEGSTGGIDAKHPTPTSSDGETTNMTTDLTTDMSEMTSSYFTDAEGIRTETGSNESVFDLRSKPAK